MANDNDPLLNAEIRYNSAPPAVPVSVPTVSARAEGSAVRLTVTGGELPENVKVLAALNGSGVLSGTYDAARSEVPFQRPLETGRKLFFLAPDTFIPLAKPAELK